MERYLFCFDRGLIFIFKICFSDIFRTCHLLTIIRTISTQIFMIRFAEIRRYAVFSLWKIMIFSLCGHSDFLIIIGKFIDADFPIPNPLYDLLFNLVNIGLLPTFNFNLMGCNNLHFVFIQFPFFLFNWITLTVLMILTSIVTYIIRIALSTSLTYC